VPAEEVPKEETPVAYENSPEEELPTAEVYPVEVYDEDPLAEAESKEGTWPISIPISVFTYSPCHTQ
jgi:hypothetical protein